MTFSDEEDVLLANFLESELSDEDGLELSDEDKPAAKRLRVSKEEEGPSSTTTTTFSQIPRVLLITHILKHLSSEDLASCSMACSFLNDAASDESLWRRLYRMRWGPTRRRDCRPWKKLYFHRDERDMIGLAWNCPSELKDCYIQMEAAKRSQAPPPASLLTEDLDKKSVADQLSMWKSSRGLTDDVSTADHACSGEACSFYHIGGDVFVCEETGKVHVCDDACGQVILLPNFEGLVCTISGRYFERFDS